MEVIVYFIEQFGLPIGILIVSLMAISVLYKDGKKRADECRSDIESYREELKDLHDKLDNRSKQFTDTINALVAALGHNRNVGDNSNDKP